MNGTELPPCVARRVAIATALFALLGATGCMTRPQAVMSAAGSVASTSGSPIIPAQGECIAFTCAVLRATLNPRQD